MAVCMWCDKEMATGASCTLDSLSSGGVVFRLPPARRACGDCGVAPGGLHHPGCDLQRCPACGWQLITCDCRFDDEDDEGLGGSDRGDSAAPAAVLEEIERRQR